ncbi:MAG: GH3 auxin-responsive promoter family protein [Blautia sp.]|nr:GH3 auxin-responsive promoter family protein [Blautia sp.]
MNNEIMKRYISEGSKVLERLEKDSLHGNAVSQELLMRLIRENENTEYGKKYGFEKIHSYDDYAARVPLSSYEDFEPYIEQMVCFNKKNLLTSKEVVYYAHTSGTTGAFKIIPCTREALVVFFGAGYERVFALYDQHCREKYGTGMPECKGITIMESKPGYTTYGVAHGAISETVLVRDEVSVYNALPEELVYPAADFDRRHLKLLFTLLERRLSFIQCSFAPFLYDMFIYLKNNWELLCEDIEKGRINQNIVIDPSMRRKLEARMKPDRERADQVRAIMAGHEDDAFVSLLWPDMKMIATIGSASFAPYLEKMRRFIGPDVAVDHLGYVSSEAVIGTVFRENQAEYMLIPWSGFFEFIPVDENGSKTPLLMDQLETGKEYELVVTNLSGFYRYRLGDVIRVTGYHNECPMIVFSYRKNQLISMYGEKVTETVIHNAVEATAEESHTSLLEYGVYADAETDPGHYTVLLESDREITPEAWPYYSEILNRKLCEAHDSYRLKIEQKIMLPLEVRFLQPQTYALYRDLKVMGGASPNQIKPLHLIPEGRLKRFFFGLLQK